MCQATLALDEIRVDGDTQCRAAMDEAVIAEYAENLDSLPPAVVYNDGTDVWLADGFYRRNAHIVAGRERMLCVVHKGTLDDAKWHAAGANRTHGVRRSPADKERAVRLALSLNSKRSDSEVASHCGVSAKSVSRYRADIKAELDTDLDDSDVPWDADSETTQLNTNEAGESHFNLLKCSPDVPLSADHAETARSPDAPEDDEVRVGKDNRPQRVSSEARSESAKQRHSKSRDELLAGLHPDVVLALDQKQIKVRDAKALAKVPQLLQAARLEEMLQRQNGHASQEIAGHRSSGAAKPPANEKPSGVWAPVHKLIGQLSRKVDDVAEACELPTNGTAIKAVHAKINEVKQLILRLQEAPR